VKKFKVIFDKNKMGESTDRLFKKHYLEELHKLKHSGGTETAVVKHIHSRKRGHPLTLGDGYERSRL